MESLDWPTFLDTIRDDKEMLVEMKKALLFDITKCRKEDLQWLNKRLEDVEKLIQALP